jgi:hypothetical protein
MLLFGEFGPKMKFQVHDFTKNLFLEFKSKKNGAVSLKP